MKTLLAACLVFLTACAGGPPVSRAPKPVPDAGKETQAPPAPALSREKALGRQFMQAALKEFTFVKDFEVRAQVNEAGGSILRAIGEDPADFHFFVVRQNTLNAFAVPGGYIFLYDGLIRELKTKDALAGVLAHEIAHVKRRHFFKNEKKMTAVSLATIASILLAGLTGQEAAATGTIAAAANISMQLKFSRENEEDADLHAIEYLKQTAYDPRGLAEFFKTLSFYAGFTRGVEPPYFSTHPGLGERRFMVEALMKDFPTRRKAFGADAVPWDRDWGRVTAILKGTGGAPDAAAPKEEGLPEGETNARRLYLSGLTLSRAGQLREAAQKYQAAIRFEPEQAVYHADLAYIWMRLQKADLAKSTALESLRLSRDNPRPHLVLGMIAQSENDHQGAVKHLEEAKTHAPDDAFLHLQLARSYHALSVPEKEKFHLGRYHRLNLEPVKALAQFQQVRGLIDSRAPLAIRAAREISEITRDGV